MSLDFLVKGSTPSGSPPPSSPAQASQASHSSTSASISGPTDFTASTGSVSGSGSHSGSGHSDPLSTLPSSPPQIYLNLLILETSLRAQYLSLRARRRQNSFFICLLGIWIAYFAYALFLRPREDGRGVGGSVYWVVETAEKVALLGGVVTAILIWGTGQWERGIRWPRKWLVVANRGLRTMNCKIVVIRGPWWKEVLSLLTFLFPFSTLLEKLNHRRSLFGDAGKLTQSHTLQQQPLQYGDQDHRSTPRRSIRASQEPDDLPAANQYEEDLSPGGDHIKLLLLPKYFSPAFRDNWDQYRAQYWEQENERRAQLRQRLMEREKQRRKAEGSWLWRTFSRIRSKSISEKRGNAYGSNRERDGSRPASRGHHHHHHHHHTPRSNATPTNRPPSIRRSHSPAASLISDTDQDTGSPSKKPSSSSMRKKSKRYLVYHCQ
ncbi:Sporulation/nuclear morphology, Spo7 [Ascosphaera apis ARSEF 7405]|uniref:Sporulation/nuclear morphology, Spo7 n=1 Tax=Ascosphaera apis ARSEF 7405 TaxID=392613 RepID=A0A168DLD7_9EURO|nr:Sporulation/nuclear morphology, Spo7 [Ascosphaera apis ARSEF 7405]